MNSQPDKALLPAGMQDGLAPAAALEAATAELLIAQFDGWGYARVKPPLMEFEENLLLGTGQAVANQAFRVQDPVSQRMLALRPDMTLQVARIAKSRLSHSPRPLRLAYSGQVARVQSSQLRPERQFGQVGVELLGATSPQADVEVVLMAAEALKAAGINDLSIDLGLPTLCPALLQDLDLDDATQATLRTALDRKDADSIQGLADQIGTGVAAALISMLTVLGSASKAIKSLNAIDLPDHVNAQRAHLNAVIEGLTAACPDLTLTLDVVEGRGFEYHTGVTFAFFSRTVMGELGRGGRYDAGEPATGVTFFMDTVMKAIAPADVPDSVFLPFGTPADAAHALRAEGWRTVAELEQTNDVVHSAKHLGCSHVLQNGTVNKLDR